MGTSASKYHNTKVIIDGIKFDSKVEASRWSELVMLTKAGKIRDLKRQVRIVLQPKFKTAGDILDGTVSIRAIEYVADFTYEEWKDKTGFTLDGRVIPPFWQFMIEDRKGMRTKDYILKKKMLLYKIATGEIIGKFVES